ncbi:MAG: biotin/lipoyl-binding protein, partial [Candidatus Paceibacterota bacterium]
MKRIKKYIKNKYVIGSLVLLFIIIVIILRSGSSNSGFEYAEVKIGNVSERVGITGQVMPIDKADLSFGKSGIVQTIAVKVGDKVERGQLIATLDSSTDKATLASAEAELAEITRGLRPEEYASDESAVNVAMIALNNSKKSALDSFRDGYVKAQGAITNYTDTFFNNPQSANPTINIRTSSYTFENAINTKRISVTENINKWKKDIDLSTTNPDALALLTKADVYLSIIKSYMSELSGIVNDLNPGNSGLTQATIDSYVTSMNNALSGLNQAILSITSAETTLRNSIIAYDQA